MLFFILMMIVQGVSCAVLMDESIDVLKSTPFITEYSRFAPHLPPGGLFPHTAIVQYRNKDKFYQVCWDTFCGMYDMATSVQMVLERNLLNCDAKKSFVSLNTEIRVLLMRGVRSLKSCLKSNERVSYDGLEGRRLRSKHLKAMFPKKQTKLWKKLSLHCRKDLEDQEVRVWFSAGGLSCVPTDQEGQNFLVTFGPRRKEQVAEEGTEEFIAKLQECARKELGILEEVATNNGGVVEVSYVNQRRRKFCSQFRSGDLVDRDGMNLREFLCYCVLQGTYQSYLGDTKTHYAFVNESLEDVVKELLPFCLEDGCGVHRSVLGELPLRPKDLRKCPPMAWMVMPQGVCQFPLERGSIFLTFAGVSLEGRPLVEKEKNFSFLVPRNYLWALFCGEFTAFEGESLYAVKWRCRRMIWDKGSPP